MPVISDVSTSCPIVSSLGVSSVSIVMMFEIICGTALTSVGRASSMPSASPLMIPSAACIIGVRFSGEVSVSAISTISSAICGSTFGRLSPISSMRAVTSSIATRSISPEFSAMAEPSAPTMDLPAL